jgi:hypothetical protein
LANFALLGQYALDLTRDESKIRLGHS